MFHNHLDYFQKLPLEGRPNTKPRDHGTPNYCNSWFILFYHVWGLAWIEIPWNSIWLRTRSHMASHYTWGSVTTLHDFGGDLGRPLDTLFWALTLSWSRLLARVWNGPEMQRLHEVKVKVLSFSSSEQSSCNSYVFPIVWIVELKMLLVYFVCICVEKSGTFDLLWLIIMSPTFNSILLKV